MSEGRARLLRKAIRNDTMELKEEIKAEAIRLLVEGYRNKWLVTLYCLFCVAVMGAWGWAMFFQAVK